MGNEEQRARRMAAIRGCDRVLSAGRPPTIRERLEQLSAVAARSDDARIFDLDSSPDRYGDGIVRELERRTAALLGLEDAAFFPTGTMAQQVALRCWAARTGNTAVALHPLAHPELHERRAFSVVSGLRTVHPTTAPRMPSAEEVADFDETFGTLMLELPLREAGFVLPSWDELTAVVVAARDRDAVVHFDGARLWECPPHFAHPLPEIAGLADSVYVSFYKALGAVSGAVLAGSESLVREAKTWRHRYGGVLFEQWPAALSALDALDGELPRLESYIAHAKVVAGALREAFEGAVPWSRVHPQEPHTHQFQVWLAYPADVLNEAGLRQAEETGVTVFGSWHESGPPGLSMTEMTVAADALEWSAQDVVAGVRALLEFVLAETKTHL